MSPTGPQADFLGSAAPWAAPDGPQTRAAERLWVAVAAVLGLAASLRYAPWSVPLEPRDSHVFFFLSERIAHGVAPYQSLFSPHNALSVIIPGLGIAFGELVGIDPVISARIMTIACLMLTVAGVGLLTWRLARNREAGALAVAFMLTFTPVAYHAASTGQPKSVLLPIVLGVLIAVQAGRFGWAGFLAAAAYLAYQPALLMLPPVVLAAAISERRRQNLVAVGLASVVALGGYLGYLASKGVVREWFVQTHLFMAATKTTDLLGPVHLREIIELWASVWRGGFGAWNVLPLVFLTTLGWLLVRLISSPRATYQGIRRNPVWLVLLPSVLGVVAYGYADIGGVPDSYFALPFIAIVSALGVTAVVETVVRRWPLVRLRAIAYVALIAFTGWIVRQAPEVYRSRFKYTLEDQRAAATDVGKYLEAGRTVFVLGPVHLLAMNHADNWIKFGSSHSVRPVWGYWDFLNGAVPFVPLRDGKLPEVIVWGGGQPLGWPDWLSKTGYAQRPDPVLAAQGIQLWLRPPPSDSGTTGPESR